MDVSEIRRRNARYLAGNEKYRAAFAESIGKSASQVNNWIGPNPTKNIGPKNARLIESAYGKPKDWLDNVHPETTGEAAIIGSLQKVKGDTVKLEYMENAAFSMGPGLAPPEPQYQIKSFETSRSWVRAKLTAITNPANVKIVTGLGDSMRGTYGNGDAIFVDTGVNRVDIDSVYAFRHREELFIKRVQRLPGGRLQMISDNEKYKPFVVDYADREDFEVLGRVVGTLNFNEV